MNYLKKDCAICHTEFIETDMVIFSHKETFTFKPADVPDTVKAASVTPAVLAASRKDYQRTAIANTFGVWGKMTIPADAFHFRHQWCEPVRTGAGPGGHAVNKHAIRYGRSAPGRMHG